MKKNQSKSIIIILCLSLLGNFGCETPKETTDKNTQDTMKINDPHSFAIPHQAVIKHLIWDAQVNFENKIISGIASYQIEKTGDADSIILDTQNLIIKKVTSGQGEKNLPYELRTSLSNEIMGTPLYISLEDDPDQINIHYETSPKAEALQWLSPVQTSGKLQPFLFTQSQAILARSWIPIQDSPGIRFTYKADVEVPPGLLALMSAENPKEKNDKGQYHFEMNQPIPAYLMALAVGDLVFEPVGKRTGVYAEPKMIDEAAYEFAEMEDMLVAAEKLYGPYRWEQYDLIVLPPSFPFGGMENPRLTFVTPTILAGDRSLTSLVAHELAHSWSGNLVTNANWNDFWLNEGFTVYFERRIMEALYGDSYAEMLSELGKQDLENTIEELTSEGNAKDTHLKLDLDDRNPDDGLTDVAYEKGYLFLKWLENEVGREKFDAFLEEYFNTNAFQTMTTEAFVGYLQRNLIEPNSLSIDKEDLDEWIYSPGLPENTPTFDSKRFAAVDSALKEWQSGISPQDLATANWSSHEWLHFIRSLPENINIDQMQRLDNTFGLNDTGNSEMLVAWLVHAIKNDYEPSFKRLEDFLINTGRRKFLVPLYENLSQSEKNQQLAMIIYQKARDNYHFVATNTLDKMLGYKEETN